MLAHTNTGTHGIGAALGEKLISVVEEKKDVQGKLEAAEGALSSSEADRERLKLEVEANESAVEGLRGEIDETRLECEALQKVRVCYYRYVFILHCSVFILLPSKREG